MPHYPLVQFEFVRYADGACLSYTDEVTPFCILHYICLPVFAFFMQLWFHPAAHPDHERRGLSAGINIP